MEITSDLEQLWKLQFSSWDEAKSSCEVMRQCFRQSHGTDVWLFLANRKLTDDVLGFRRQVWNTLSKTVLESECIKPEEICDEHASPSALQHVQRLSESQTQDGQRELHTVQAAVTAAMHISEVNNQKHLGLNCKAISLTIQHLLMRRSPKLKSSELTIPNHGALSMSTHFPSSSHPLILDPFDCVLRTNNDFFFNADGHLDDFQKTSDLLVTPPPYVQHNQRLYVLNDRQSDYIPTTHPPTEANDPLEEIIIQRMYNVLGRRHLCSANHSEMRELILMCMTQNIQIPMFHILVASYCIRNNKIAEAKEFITLAREAFKDHPIDIESLIAYYIDTVNPGFDLQKIQ